MQYIEARKILAGLINTYVVLSLSTGVVVVDLRSAVSPIQC